MASTPSAFEELEHLAKLPRRNWRWTPRIMCAAIITAFVVGIAIDDMVEDEFTRPVRAAVELSGVHLEQTKLKAGDTLWMNIYLKQTQECRGIIDRVFARDFPDGKTSALHMPTYSFRNQPGSVQRDVGVTVPPEFGPGTYTYRAAALLKCVDGRDYTVDTGPLAFEIID